MNSSLSSRQSRNVRNTYAVIYGAQNRPNRGGFACVFPLLAVVLSAREFNLVMRVAMLDTTQSKTRFSTKGLVMPRSIAFTPDKNRTYAMLMGLRSPLDGHTAGKDNAKRIINACFRSGLSDVLFWVMSASNIHKRSVDEKNHIVSMLKKEMRRRGKNDKEDERLFMCGAWQEGVHDKQLERLVAQARRRTSKKRVKQLTLLFGYSGMQDIQQAAAKVARKFDPEAVMNSDLLRAQMWISHVPPAIDMLVRTGVTDETRHNSDSFLPLHGQNAFIYDVPVCWPEFTTAHLHEGFRRFSACRRLKGA